ncbi:MAG: hypothetical protein LCH67_20080 [Bacteroidetes bacterium]|nr:hypothetical protein [Bacteroidota bacterium]
MAKHLKGIITVLVFVLAVAKSYGQRDLIITQAGEEIRCKILDETPTRFVYAYLGAKNKILRNEIFKNLVSSFKYNYYSSDVLKNDKMISKPSAADSGPRVDTRQKDASKSVEPVKKDNSGGKTENQNNQGKQTAKEPEKDKSNVLPKTNPSTPAKEINTQKTDEKPVLTEKQNTDIASAESKQNVKTSPDKVAETKSEASTKNETPGKAIEKKDTKTVFNEPAPESEFKNFLNFRVGIKGGLGNIIGKNTDVTPYGLYKEKLLRGYMYGADIAYFFKDNVGLGFSFTNYNANNSSDQLDYPNLFTGETITKGELSNKVSHKFVGPTLLVRKSIDFKTFVVLTASPGMFLYSDKGVTNKSNFKFTGNSFGGAATLGLDFLLGNDIFGRDIILSLEAGYNYGQIKKLNLGDATGVKTLATPINLNRLDFGVGLRFTRFPMYLR